MWDYFLAESTKRLSKKNVPPSRERNNSISQIQQVKECFSRYKSAILNDEGEKAADYVDSRTINYYSKMLEVTKAADSAEVNRLNILDKLMVFTIRHRTSKRRYFVI